MTKETMIELLSKLETKMTFDEHTDAISTGETTSSVIQANDLLLAAFGEEYRIGWDLAKERFIQLYHEGKLELGEL